MPEDGPGMAITAIGLLSGGLDSTLAARLMLDQGIAVHAINFVSPFCTCTPKSAGCAAVVSAVRQLGDIPLKRIVLGDEYLEMVKNPKYGYGRGLNPCIDCRIMKLRKAAEYMREIGALFLFTGEVLGQRNMSQNRDQIAIIDKDSELDSLILRPLSAKLFPPTLPERNGWVDRNALLAITGRSRKPQIALAARTGVNDYRCSAGGCLLTDPRFAERLKDYFAFVERPSCAAMARLKTGRHFRCANGEKIIVARNKMEGERLRQLTGENDQLFDPDNFSAPLVLLEGRDRSAAVHKMLEYTNKRIPTDARLRVRAAGCETILPLSRFIETERAPHEYSD